MTLGNMRAQGIRDVVAHCEAASCFHSATVNVGALPDDLPVPDVALRLVCSKCGRRQIKTIPDWSQGRWHRRFSKDT
jgi:hypothetical protein